MRTDVAQSVLMSVIETCRWGTRSVLDHIARELNLSRQTVYEVLRQG